jgi:putative flippase GtrA
LNSTELPRLSRAREFLKSDVAKAAQKYFVVGGFSALIDWGFFAVFLYVFGLHYLVAGILSFALATAANYFLSVRFVFGAGRRKRAERIFLVYVVSFAVLGFNLVILMIGIDTLHTHEMLAKIMATALAFGLNFAGRYYFVFKK